MSTRDSVMICAEAKTGHPSLIDSYRPLKIILCIALLASLLQPCHAKLTEDQLRKARADLEKGNYGTILSSLPNDDAKGLVLKGRALLAIDSDTGGKFLTHALELAPHDPEVMVWAAAGFLKWKFYPKALTTMNEAVALYPRNGDVHSMLGRCLLKVNQSEAGFRAMKKALQLDPKSFVAYVNLADSDAEQLDTVEARNLLTKAMSAYPNNPWLYVKRAQLSEDAGDTKGALNDYATAISMNPRFQLAYRLRGNLLTEKGEYKKALEDCSKCLTVDTVEETKRKCLQVKVRCEEKLGMTAAAIEDLNVLLKDVPKYTDIDGTTEKLLLRRAADYELTKDYPKALETISLVQRLKKKRSTEALVLRANVHTEMGDTRSALSDFNELMSIDGSVPDWYRGRAAIFQKLGKPDAAQRDLKKAKEIEATM